MNSNIVILKAFKPQKTMDIQDFQWAGDNASGVDSVCEGRIE